MWLYHNKEFVEDDIGDMVGFVYRITNLIDNRKYIGKKLFTKAGRKQVKGKIKKVRKASDWLSYYGSNDELKKDVATLGAENFKREILYLCKTKAECNYLETYEIFIQDALLKEEYYNSWVSVRVTKKHVMGKIEN